MKFFTQKHLAYGLLAIIAIVIGAIYIWAPVCDGLLELKNGNMVHMKCFYTAQASTIIAILLLVQSIYTIITNKKNPFMVIALGIMLILVTFESIIGIGVCKKVMACHETAFWLRASGTLTIVIGLVSLFKKELDT
ncbi:MULTISPECIES: DUF4418 family protein [Desulfitobacterium]|uniref:DUF4418 family protein n=1 Tax=Desulfitobacterium dehalogenans (strain ATCC 51507 / DSM 9161 / JW/IU-DC1) TaxID=756499 RepID=I4A3I4_DESDJ|nr:MULTISPECIES: DUF4418 family protein [Desulfitobacterium]AFL98518.1 hypothetical protein Desde_0021 [Desulfitobacterium dehalogenans ATCC 51507]